MGSIAAAVAVLVLGLPGGALAAEPTATTVSATGVSSTGASLNGTVDPGGEPTKWYFEYADAAEYESVGYAHTTSARALALSFNQALPGLPLLAPTAVSFQLNGLTPATTYHFRLVVVQNACLGTPLEDSCPKPPVAAFGNDLTFRTTGPPTGSTLAATAVGNRTATLNAVVNPNGLETTYRFEWGTTTSYGGSIPASGSAGAGTTDQPLFATLPDLEPGTEYHYRLVASNEAGETVGADVSFTTSSVPIAVTDSADELTSTGARLNGTANAQNGAGTEYEFEYCEEVDFDPVAGSCSASQSTPAREMTSADAEDHAVSEPLPDGTLTPATAYRFRLVVANESGTDEGAYVQFETPSADPPAVAPTAITGTATSVGNKTATLNGLVNPNGLVTTYRFEYGTSPADFSRSTAAGTLAADSEPHAVARDLSGLKPRTTYYYRVVAESAAGKATGGSGTFTTGPQSGKDHKGR